MQDADRRPQTADPAMPPPALLPVQGVLPGLGLPAARARVGWHAKQDMTGHGRTSNEQRATSNQRQ